MATPVPEKFRTAKTTIDNYRGPNSPFDSVLANWSTADKTAFATWYRTETATQRNQTIQAQKALPAVTMTEYINALKAVDFLSLNSVMTFINKAQSRDWQPTPLPIILGSDSGTQYQLRSQFATDIDPAIDLASGTKPSDCIIEVRATEANLTSPIKYMFPLGELRTVSSASANTPAKEAGTPYRVCINPVNRSIWLIMNLYTIDGVGEREPIPRDADTWSLLRVPANGRASFDVIQIATWNEFIALNQTSAPGRAIFSTQNLATAKRVQPVFYAAPAAAVEAAVRAPPAA